MMEKFSNLIVRFRGTIILVVVLLTLFFGYQIKNLTINSDVISSLPDDDPYASLLKEVGEKFGGNKIGMVILETDNIFRKEVLEHVAMITDTLKEIEGISSVTSLTNIISISSGSDGLEVSNLVDPYDPPDTPEELDALKARVYAKDLYKGNIVSADGTATVVMFSLLDSAQVEKVSRLVIAKTRAMNFPEKLYYAGAPMMVTSISDLISKDLVRLIPVSFIVIALTLMLGFRTKRGVFMPLLVCGISIVWTMGTMSLLGFQLTMVSNNIPILLLAVGSAYTIHVLNRIAQVKGNDKRLILVTALKHVMVPVMLAGLTTMIGFLSFIFGSYLEMIRDFGLFTALGTFFAVALSLLFVPAVVYNLRIRQDNLEYEAITLKKSYLSKKYLSPLSELLFRHPKYILTSWALLIAIGITGLFLIKRNVNIQDYFKKGNPTRMAEQIMEKDFGGSKPIFVVFDGDMQSPEVLNTMVRCEEYMRKSPNVLTTQSVADLVLDLSEGLGEGRQIPADQGLIQQLWFLIDGNEMLKRLVSDDLQQGVIISKFLSPENKDKKAFGEYMQKFIDENSTESCRIRITGMPFIDVTMNRSLLLSQVGSLSIAVVLVIIIVSLILRSLLKGFLATVPMMAAILILFGVMGLGGIPLNIATVLVASVALGIGIDYSIHIISNFNYLIEKGENIHHAVEDTILISGKAIVINVVSVAAGFMVLMFSEMVPLQYFGLLIGISMIASSQAAMTFLPVILILIDRRKPFKARSSPKSPEGDVTSSFSH